MSVVKKRINQNFHHHHHNHNHQQEERTMSVNLSIHFGIPSLAASAGSPYADAQKCPTVTVRVDDTVDADGNKIVRYYFAYMNRHNDRISFGEFTEEPTRQNRIHPVHFYGFNEYDDFEVKEYPELKGFFTRNLNYAEGEEMGDHLRNALIYLALVKRLNESGITAKYFPEKQEYLMGMRKIIVDAHNDAQVKIHESEGDFSYPIFFSGCSTLMLDKLLDRGKLELERALQLYSNGGAFCFKGNILSDEFGMVYSYKDGEAIAATYYPQCYWNSNSPIDELLTRKEKEKKDCPTEAFVKDSPIGDFRDGKLYKVLELVEKMGTSYAKVEDENKKVICLRMDRLATPTN